MQIERYRPKRIEMNDLIIDQAYFTRLFPKQSKLKLDVEIFYETKAHLKREHLEVLAGAGVRKIQAGIESLSPNSVKKISKGVSVSRYLEFLSDCDELGIQCYWNYLHSFPGETASELLSAIPVISDATQQQPPATFQPARVERFSPLLSKPICALV